MLNHLSAKLQVNTITFLSIYMFTNLYVYWFTFLAVYKNKIFQKTEERPKKNEQKKNRRDGMRYSITPLLLLENFSYNTVNLYQIVETKYILP